MDARTQELLDRLISPGQFPNMSCSEGHELYDGVIDYIESLEAPVEDEEWKQRKDDVYETVGEGGALDRNAINRLIADRVRT